MSKGSARRKSLIDNSIVQDNWNKIFKNTEDVTLVNVDTTRCPWWDCGWCYYSQANKPHACPGITKCDLNIEKTT